jgi:hypothetical protein
MASQGYRDWLKAGKPYSLIRPADELVTTLRAYGLTVYHYPNDAHLQANTPEDHTPYSVTGWPTANARWRARGVDVMPRSTSAVHRKENADIARQLIKDRNAGNPGVAWIKYINWTDEPGVTRQERWTPNHTTRSSSDKGHIHISGRSDMDFYTGAAGYDPIRRMAGVDTPIGAPMGQQMIVYNLGTTPAEQAQHWIVDGMQARRVPMDFVYGDDLKGVDGPVTNVQIHQSQFLGNLGNGGQPFKTGGDIRVWGEPIGEEIHLDADILAKTIATAVIASMRDQGASAEVSAEDIADLLAARLKE